VRARHDDSARNTGRRTLSASGFQPCRGPATSDQALSGRLGLALRPVRVDYFNLHGYLRWTLILVFMVLKAGLIVAIFMHMAWERLALAYAILLPPIFVLVFVALMVIESDYVHLGRTIFFGGGS